jgi:hypothetical protein
LNTLTELEVKVIFLAMNAVTCNKPELASKQDLREMEYRLTIKVGAMLGATIAIITTLDKLL